MLNTPLISGQKNTANSLIQDKSIIGNIKAEKLLDLIKNMIKKNRLLIFIKDINIKTKERLLIGIENVTMKEKFSFVIKKNGITKEQFLTRIKDIIIEERLLSALRNATKEQLEIAVDKLKLLEGDLQNKFFKVMKGERAESSSNQSENMEKKVVVNSLGEILNILIKIKIQEFEAEKKVLIKEEEALLVNNIDQLARFIYLEKYLSYVEETLYSLIGFQVVLSKVDLDKMDQGAKPKKKKHKSKSAKALLQESSLSQCVRELNRELNQEKIKQAIHKINVMNVIIAVQKESLINKCLFRALLLNDLEKVGFFCENLNKCGTRLNNLEDSFNDAKIDRKEVDIKGVSISHLSKLREIICYKNINEYFKSFFLEEKEKIEENIKECFATHNVEAVDKLNKKLLDIWQDNTSFCSVCSNEEQDLEKMNYLVNELDSGLIEEISRRVEVFLGQWVKLNKDCVLSEKLLSVVQTLLRIHDVVEKRFSDNNPEQIIQSQPNKKKNLNTKDNDVVRESKSSPNSKVEVDAAEGKASSIFYFKR